MGGVCFGTKVKQHCLSTHHQSLLKLEQYNRTGVCFGIIGDLCSYQQAFDLKAKINVPGLPRASGKTFVFETEGKVGKCSGFLVYYKGTSAPY